MAEERKPVIANAWTTRNEATCKLVKELSINLWKKHNAGYVIPKRPPISFSHENFQYKRELLDKKSYEFHRRRDSFTEYAEAAAREKNIFGASNKDKAPAKKGKGGAKGGKGAAGSAPATPAASSPATPALAEAAK